MISPGHYNKISLAGKSKDTFPGVCTGNKDSMVNTRPHRQAEGSVWPGGGLLCLSVYLRMLYSLQRKRLTIYFTELSKSAINVMTYKDRSVCVFVDGTEQIILPG